MSKEEIKSIIIHNAKHLGSVDVHMQNLLIDVNMLVEQLANIERQARIEALQWVLDNLSDQDTDCGEFYMNDSPADDGCTVEEHNRREGRFYYRMETQDLIKDRLAELEREE